MADGTKAGNGFLIHTDNFAKEGVERLILALNHKYKNNLYNILLDVLRAYSELLRIKFWKFYKRERIYFLIFSFARSM
jgi:hypothetical protein